MAKKDWKQTGKLSKFDYRCGTRLLLARIFLGITLAFLCVEIIFGVLWVFLNIQELAIPFFIFAILTVIFGLCVFIACLLPKTEKEIFANVGGYTVLDLECSPKEGTLNYIGSAIMINKGIAVTNAHIIIDEERKVCEKINCYFLAESCKGRAKYKAVLVKYDLELDIAILSVIPKRYKETFDSKIKCGTVSSVKAGDKIYVVENADGNGVCFSQGEIRLPLVEEEWKGKKNYFIEYTASTIDGNSGGAILNKKGKLIGMHTWRKKGSNFCYAISVDRIIEYVNDIDSYFN